MPTESSIVTVPKGGHRRIAQRHWGLTDEQMKGMHVHHRIPRSKGGTNDPSNLFVCSPWFHSHVWHGEDSYLPWVENASKGGKVKTGPISDSHRKNLSIARTGYVAGPMSEEQKKLLSQIKTGSKPSWDGSYPKMSRRDPSVCPECGRTFVNKGSMVSHQKRVHNKPKHT